MFTKERYQKNNPSQNYGPRIPCNKYHPKIYAKNKTSLKKKISNQLWKNQPKYNIWKERELEKENDKNYLNYSSSKKYYSYRTCDKKENLNKDKEMQLKKKENLEEKKDKEDYSMNEYDCEYVNNRKNIYFYQNEEYYSTSGNSQKDKKESEKENKDNESNDKKSDVNNSNGENNDIKISGSDTKSNSSFHENEELNNIIYSSSSQENQEGVKEKRGESNGGKIKHKNKNKSINRNNKFPRKNLQPEEEKTEFNEEHKNSREKIQMYISEEEINKIQKKQGKKNKNKKINNNNYFFSCNNPSNILNNKNDLKKSNSSQLVPSKNLSLTLSPLSNPLPPLNTFTFSSLLSHTLPSSSLSNNPSSSISQNSSISSPLDQGQQSSQSNEPFNKFNSVNQELGMTQIINPIVENTEILSVNVKIAKDKIVVFKLRRFDDLFLTVKLFCEINCIKEKFMKPIITKALCTLNSIYQIYNAKLDSKNIKVLKMLNNFYNDTSI